ncbi:signal recognition protein [Stemphylium lycopersici]|nr:signal recognition protein [Stemphylium lycopersici]
MDITKFVAGYRESASLLGDYNAYRDQLSRRLRIVNKKLGRATPKNAKYAAKAPVTAEDLHKNSEALHILLLNAERAWAQAMAMKASHSEDNADKSITGATRKHIVSRLHKAVQYANQAVELVSDTSASGASDADVLEARAYAYALAGAQEFEKQAEGVKSKNASPQRWSSCLINYSAARVIYSSLLKSTKNDLFKEVLAGTTDPSIRYAAYQSRIPRTVGVPTVATKYFPKDDAKLLQAVQKLDPAALEEEEAASSHSQITWRGRTANVVDAAIGQALASVDTASSVLDETTSSSTSPKDRANAYDDILIASQDAVDATRRAIEELEKEGVDEGDSRMQDLRVTNLAVNYHLISWRVGRNRVLVGKDDGLTFPANPPQKPRRQRKDGKEWVEREEPTGRKLARLRERTALYDAILQSIDSVKELRGAARDTGFVAELDGQRAYFQALKCLNLSHSYAFLSTPKQALALCSRALSLASQAVSALQSESPSTSKAPKLHVTGEQASTLKENLENLNSHYRGVVALSQLFANSETASKAGLANAAPVVERLNEYPSSGSVDLKNLVTWPPKLKPVPVKPLFLDVAWNYVEYPGRARQVQEPEAQPAPVEEKKEEKPQAKKGWFSFGRYPDPMMQQMAVAVMIVQPSNAHKCTNKVPETRCYSSYRNNPSVFNDLEERHAFLDLNNFTTASALATSILPRPQVDDSFRRPSILHVFDLPAFKTPTAASFEDRLPSITHDISRPSSSSTVASHTPQRNGSNASPIQLPSLATLASAASNCPAAHTSSNESNDNTRKDTPEQKMPSPPSTSNGLSMTYATSAPATAGGQAGSPPVCQNCSTSTTPLWRRDESGAVLCNACGLFLKLHGRPRPISLKTDVIKSRNRVKTGGPGGRKRTSDQGGLPAAHPDADGQLALAQHRRASGKISSGLSDRSNSPISRTGTPNFGHPANIAPQHMFEQALHGGDFHSPSLPGFGLRAPSPATSSVNGSHLEAPLPYETLAAQNTALKTRVSEMELINDLFRNRVSELEQSEQSARQTESSLRQELEETKQREADLKRRLEEIENESPRHKRMKMSEFVDESRAGTPISAMVD